MIQRYEIEYSIKLKNTIDDFIKKNIKSQQYYNLKEKRLIKFIYSLCYFNKYYYRYRGQLKKEILPCCDTFPITCSNTIIVLFPFEQISILFPFNIFTPLNI